MKRIIAAKFALALKSSRKRLYWACAITGALSLTLVAYAASGWSTPVTLATPIPPTYYVTSSAVATNSSGAQAAAWVSENNYLLLQVAAQDAGEAWRPNADARIRRQRRHTERCYKPETPSLSGRFMRTRAI